MKGCHSIHHIYLFWNLKDCKQMEKIANIWNAWSTVIQQLNGHKYWMLIILSHQQFHNVHFLGVEKVLLTISLNWPWYVRYLKYQLKKLERTWSSYNYVCHIVSNCTYFLAKNLIISHWLKSRTTLATPNTWQREMCLS